MKQTLITLAIIAGAVAIALLVAMAGASHGLSLAGYPLLLWCAALAFLVQWLVFVPSYLAQTEHYYDLTGSLTYLALVALALAYGTHAGVEAMDARSLLIAALVFIWAARLGPFLFRRIKRAGKDGRFDRIKAFWPRFLVTWTLQGLWVFITLAAALTAMTTTQPQPLGPLAILGAAIWLLGFALETIADAQKSAFNADPANAGRFVDIGLWRWSRHPNYFGEIVLWVGVSLIALPVLQGWQFVTLISPVFVALLLTRISGIPLLEKRADQKWGDDDAYRRYKASTPVLVPRPPARHA